MTPTESASSRTQATQLLHAWRAGDEGALEQLTPMLYQELRRSARRYMSGERSGHTLQPTALVNEAYIRLLGMEVDWQDRAHFFAVAAQTMRRVLIDHSRTHRSKKRSGGVQVTLNEVHSTEDPRALDALDLDRGLTKLTAQDPETARIVELHYFGGLTGRELAEVTEISLATVERRLRFAKAWLHRELTGSEPE